MKTRIPVPDAKATCSPEDYMSRPLPIGPFIYDFRFLGYLHGLTKIAHRFGNFLLSGKYCLDFLIVIFCLVSRLNLCQDFGTILLQVH